MFLFPNFSRTVVPLMLTAAKPVAAFSRTVDKDEFTALHFHVLIKWLLPSPPPPPLTEICIGSIVSLVRQLTLRSRSIFPVLLAG